MSAECLVAQQLPDQYAELHDECKDLAAVPLVHGNGILLRPACACSCHRQAAQTAATDDDSAPASADTGART